MRIKEALRQRGPAMIFGYFGEHNVYIPTRENVRLDLYQSQVSREQYACPVGWSLGVEDRMVEAALNLVGEKMYIDPRARRSSPLRWHQESN